MRRMSEGAGGADFFGRIPLFREFARLMATGAGPVNWELARQVAVAAAAGADALGGQPQPPVRPGRVLVLPENVRALEDASGLPGDQLRLWLACQAVAADRLYGGVA